MQRLREEVRQLKQSVELVTNTTPENLVEQILTYATLPLSEFNNYEVLEMLEILHNKASVGNHDKKKYYRLIYQTVRGKVDWCKDHFTDLVMRLLGDKDHERVLEIVCKVEKSNRKNSLEREGGGARVARSSRPFNVRCYFCNRRGHIKANCPDRKSGHTRPSSKSDK